MCSLHGRGWGACICPHLTSPIFIRQWLVWFFHWVGHGLEYKIKTIKFFAHPFDYLCCHGNSSAGGNGMKLSMQTKSDSFLALLIIDLLTILRYDLHQIGDFNYLPLQSCWAKSSMRCTTFWAGSSSVVKKSLLGFLTSDLSSSLIIFGPLPMVITFVPFIQGSCGLE